jgi:transcriptional regulator with XRE-family HTH domain
MFLAYGLNESRRYLTMSKAKKLSGGILRLLKKGGFAELLGISPRTLRDWEQGRRNPSGAAKTLLLIAAKHPEVLRELAA